MTKDSKSYASYAEYARRSLLRLRLVKGLSDELIVAIILRGISDPHIKAAATNAKLQPNDLVQFMSMYVKPKNDFRSTRDVSRVPHFSSNSMSRNNGNKRGFNNLICHFCGKVGHKRAVCISAKRKRPVNHSESNSAKTELVPMKICTFCKKSGHLVSDLNLLILTSVMLISVRNRIVVY